MWPFFHEGDELLVSFEQNPIESGDIVLVKDDHSWVSHRIVSDKGGLYLKGDFATNLEFVNQSKIWGVVQGFKRKNRSYIWGSEGHPLKSMVAELSKLALMPDNKHLTRLKRWGALATLFILSKTIARPGAS